LRRRFPQVGTRLGCVVRLCISISYKANQFATQSRYKAKEPWPPKPINSPLRAARTTKECAAMETACNDQANSAGHY
jgi:hypothetical protein